MAINNQQKALALTQGYLNLPTTSGISPQGYWFYYLPVDAGNTQLGASIVPYLWNNPLPLLNNTPSMVIDGTVPLIEETWQEAPLKYHGSSIEWIGAGVNDITATPEADAFFFGHLGSLSPATDDDAFYWDRAYLDINGASWQFYQYHKHVPSFYPKFENGRMTHSARGYVNPDDKAYGYMINTHISVMGTSYQSIMARIHTPSIGGAHNSHNDVTLPSVSTKNYMPGGILKGNSNRFHAFYIAASGSQWTVYNRTYTQASLSFSPEVNLGDFDLADPTFNPVDLVGTQSQYPIRASAGMVYGSRIYFPVILNNSVSGFDLEIWSFNSLDTIAGGSLIRHTVATGLAVRPDCHIKVFNEILYAAYTDTANSGVSIKSYEFLSNTWTSQGQLVTNGANHLRVHGFEYNPADTKFYVMLSGTSTGSGTYTGPGLYTFQLAGTFPGYKHYDYDAASNSFITRDALDPGYLQYNQVSGTITRYNTTEPSGIALGTNILEYSILPPKFTNRYEVAIGGDEYYYQGIYLNDGRKLLAGRIEHHKDDLGRGDFFVSLIDNIGHNHHFATGGTGADYVTGMYQSKVDPNRVWLTGYTKSQLVEKKDIKIHGYCRNVADGANEITFVDHVILDDGSMIAIGNHSDGYAVIFKYDSNYEIVWQNTYNDAAGVDSVTGIALSVDGHIFVSGTSIENGNYKAILLRVNPSGRLEQVTEYGDGDNSNGTGVVTVLDNGTEYVVLSVVDSFTTTLIVVDQDGDIIKQNTLSDLVINKLSVDVSVDNAGKFLFAGSNQAGAAKFGGGSVLGIPMVGWVSTYGSNSVVNDIHPIDANNVVIVGSAGTNAFIAKIGISGATATKVWATAVSTSVFNGCVVSSNAIYAVGYTTASGILNMGMQDALVTRFSLGGSLVWQNVFGHDMDEQFKTVTMDPTEENLVISGWSESHSFGREGVLFRCWTGGYGTGIYHIEGNPGQYYIYVKSTLPNSTESSSLASLTPPTDVSGGYVKSGGVFVPFTGDSYTVGNSGTNNYVFTGGDLVGALDPTITLARGGTYTFTMAYSGSHPFFIKELDVPGGTIGLYNTGVTNNGASTAGVVVTFTVPADAPDTLYYRCGNHSGMGGVFNIVDNPSLVGNFDIIDRGFTINKYDGSFGPDGVFMFWLGYLDLEEIQSHMNRTEHNSALDAFRLDYHDNLIKYWQVATVGDGTADDGGIFGYDIIEATDGKVWAIAQTSGDISRTNQGGSGVYDYLLIEFDPQTEVFEYYQNGTSSDEETYSLTELANGKIAFVGRTTGTLGGVAQGGYDIFLGIHDPLTHTTQYYSTGTGLDDKGINVHDVGNGTLAVVFTTYGTMGAFSSGTEDIGVIYFNYVNGTWGQAYQTGSQTSEIVEQNGKSSVLLGDGRIAIVCSSAGIFADNEETFGFLDLCVGVLDPGTGLWKKYQVGSGASDFASSVDSVGDRLLITGYSRSTFADSTTNGIAVELDVQYGVGAKSTA